MTASLEMLVIGYGNPLRGDDAAGQKVADTLAQLNLSGLQAVSLHQLTPELAETISHARRVVFVDASATPQVEIELRPLEPAESSRVTAHAASPGSLLAMARDLYGSVPTAWLLTIPSERMDFGETTSALADRGIESAIAKIRELASRPA